MEQKRDYAIQAYSKEIKVTVAKDEEVEVPGDEDDSDKPGVDIKPGGGNQNGNNSNNKPGSIPQTGGTNTIYYVIIALVLVAGGILFVIKNKKTK